MAALLGEARIVIDQATLGPGSPGVARNDGVLSELVTVRNHDNTNVTRWEWILLKPRGSTAAMSAPTAASSQFEPDVDGTYLVMLLVNEGKSSIQKAKSLLAVQSTGGMRFPAQGESNEANWTSTYTGLANETGYWEDLVDILRANQAVFDGTLLTVNLEAALGASRQITAGDGIDFDDAGAQGAFTISVTPGWSGVESLEDTNGQAENLRATRVNNPAVRSATKLGQVALGSGGATSESYTAVLAGLGGTASALYSLVVGGNANTASGAYGFVGCGETNTADGAFSVVVGGDTNAANGDSSSIVGGNNNRINPDKGFIGGGSDNIVTGVSGVIVGGTDNTASGQASAIGGGATNTASGTNSCVGGGTLNQATNTATTVSGGASNVASVAHASIGGGQSNTANAAHATCAGGQSNGSAGAHAAIGGGQTNSVTAAHGTIAGGQGNLVNAAHGFVGGGTGNTAGDRAAIGGGTGNTAEGAYASIGGGNSNVASGLGAHVSGGLSNTASGDLSAVFGGGSCIASNDYTIAIGRAAQATHAGSHVQKDGNASAVASSANNQLTQSYLGGIRQFFVGSTHRRSAYSSTANYEETYQGQATTTGNTAVNLDIIGIPTGKSVHCRGHIIGKRNTNSDAAIRTYEGAFLNVGGVITSMTALVNSLITNGAGNTYTVTVAANSTNIRVTYQGVAATTIYWTWNFTFSVGGGP